MPRPNETRLFRWLLRLFPADFRREFGESMRLDFEDEHCAARARGVGTLVRLWFRTVPGLFAASARAWREDLARDVHFAVRLMARTPLVTLTAIAMIALGTGVNAAVFSVVDVVLFGSGVPDPGRVVLVLEQRPGESPMRTVPLTHVASLAQAPTVAAVSPMSGSLAVLTNVGDPHRILVSCVAPSMFRLLGVAPALGRVLTPADDRPDADPVVVLAHAEWQRDFGGARDVLGRVVMLNGRANTIVGVMPEGYLGPFQDNRVAAFAPIQAAIAHRSAAGCDVSLLVDVVARLTPPATTDTAAAAINASGLIARLPLPSGGTGALVSFTRADTFRFAALRMQFLALVGAAACVLLIACANVVNLQLERGIDRRRELAVRLSLGATRGRLWRQTLTETIVLAGAGAACGLALASPALRVLVTLMSDHLPRVASIAVTGRTAVVTACLALVVGIALGAVGAFLAGASSTARDLRASSRSVTGSRQWWRRAIVASEVALAVMLLAGALLTVRTFVALRPINPGFESDGRYVAQMSLNGSWRDSPERADFFRRVVDRISAVPGVASASATSYLPFGGMTSLTAVRHDGAVDDVWTSWISSGLIGDLGMRVTQGRGFTDADGRGTSPVALVNEAFVVRFLTGRKVLGQVFDVRSPDRVITARRIVGVVRDTRAQGVDVEHRAELYVPIAQEAGSTLLYIVIRTNGPASPRLPSQVRDAVSAVLPGQVVDSVGPFADIVDRGLAQPRLGAWLFGVFAALAVILAAAGLAAVITWWVAQRTREIGIRIALGADRRSVVRLVVGEGLWIATAGTCAGVVMALLGARVLREWLYGVTPITPSTFAVSALAILVVAGFAAYLPARRATSIDPLTALRTE